MDPDRLFALSISTTEAISELFRAINRDDSPMIELLLNRSDVDVNFQDKDGRTPLSYAAEKGNYWPLHELLKKNDIEVDCQDGDGRTPLSYAAEKGHVSIVKKLLRRDDVSADSKNKRGRTPLSYAAEMGNDSIMEQFMERDDVDINFQDEDGRTPLSYAAEKGQESIVAALLERNNMVADSADKDGRTPLSYAVDGGHKAIVSKLLSGRYDVNINSKDKDGRTPLSYAAEKGYYSVVYELLENNILADSTDKDGRTPLSYAADKGHSVIVTVLLRRNVNAESEDKFGRTPLSYAAEKGHMLIVTNLLDRSANTGSENKHRTLFLPLSYATKMVHTAIGKKLSYRHNADLTDKDGRTPLSYAAENGHMEIVTELLDQHNANADSKDKDGRTPLSHAAEKGHLEIVTKLLDRHNVNADSKDMDSRTPLSYASEKGHLEIVTKLLDGYNANVDSKGKDDQMPLSYIMRYGWAAYRLLKKNNILADSADKDGRTPFSYAAEKGHESIVEILLKRDVVSDSVDKDGRTPLWYAKKNAHASVITILSKGGDTVKVANASVSELGGMSLKWESSSPDSNDKAVVQEIVGSNNPVGVEGIAGQVVVLAAKNALGHVDKHASDISQTLAQYNIHHDYYAVQTGFNSELFSHEVGLLEEITVLSAIVPEEDDLAPLLDSLGKILSPFPGLFCTKHDVHPTPIFKEGGEKWDIDAYTLKHVKWSPLLSHADIVNNVVFQQHLKVSSQPLRDDDTSKGDISQTSSRPGERGNSHQAQKGKGKEKENWQNEDDSARQTDMSHRNVDKNHNPEDEELPIVHFDVSVVFNVPNQLPSDHHSDTFKIIGTISIPKAEAQAQKMGVKFEQLNFQGLSGSKYTQSSARVAIDARHPTTIITVKHPHKSAASTNEKTVTNTDETDFNLGGNVLVGAIQFTKKLLLSGMVQGGPSLLVSRKRTEAVVRTQMLSRITNFQDRGVVWWGFEVDDTNFRQHGIELQGKDLPNVDFKYRGKGPLNLSTHFNVEVAAYWSMPSPNKEWFTSPQSVPLYHNLCQVVVLDIPRTLEESLDYFEHITADIGPDGKIHIVKGNEDFREISEPLEGKNLIEDVQDPKSIQQKSLSDVSHLEIPSLRINPTTNQDVNDEWSMVDSSSSHEPRPQVESHPLTNLTSP